jgi:predicted acyltransferase
MNSTSIQDTPARLDWLDQFRGYTVLGMFLVNFAGSYWAVEAFLPTLKHWHTHCSYADTIMPQFLFLVGFGFRLSFSKRMAQSGIGSAVGHSLQRTMGLFLVAFIIHHLDGRIESWQSLREMGLVGFLQTAFQREFFQTLGHIATTTLWILPVIGLGVWVRLAYMLLSAGLLSGCPAVGITTG